MRKFLISFFFMFPLLSWSGGDWIGNGASLSENRILIALQGIEKYITATLQDSKLTLTDTEKVLLTKISTSVGKEKQLNPYLVQFKPHSALFIIEGKPKVAVTGLNIGDTIFFNQDLLHQLDPNRGPTEISLLQAISLLVHELGHHQGVTDHTFLDQLGAKVADRARFEESWYPVNPQFANLGAQHLFVREGSTASAELMLSDSEKYFDVRKQVERLELCNQRVMGSRLTTINFWNLYWQRPMGEGPHLIGYLIYECQTPRGEFFTRIGDQFNLSVQINKIGTLYQFSFEPMQLNIYPCEADGVGCERIKKMYLSSQINKNEHDKNEEKKYDFK